MISIEEHVYKWLGTYRFNTLVYFSLYNTLKFIVLLYQFIFCKQPFIQLMYIAVIILHIT